MDMPEGIIKLDDPFAVSIGFNSKRFKAGSYLWGVPDENTIWLSHIQGTKRRGFFRELMEKIVSMGLIFKIPTPSGRMLEIGAKQGWKLNQYYEPKVKDWICYLTNEG